MKKLLKLLLLSLVVCNTGYATYPVHDASSIAQEAKSYAETAKLVALETQKVAMAAQDLTSLAPQELQDILSAYKTTAFSINSIISDGNYIYNAGSSLQDIHQVYENKFRRLDPRTITYSDYRQSYRDNNEELTKDTEKYQVRYNLLMQQLQQEQKNLQKLLEQNKNVKGNVQAQQIANSIAACQANIQAIIMALEQLRKQRQGDLEMAELRRKENLENLMDRIAKENSEYIEKLDTTSTIKLTATSPFEKYGRVTWSR